MKPTSTPRITALAFACLALAAHADSFTSTASSAGSATVGSVSDSLQTSSGSSSRAVNLAQGDYRVVDVVVVDHRPGVLRVRLAQVTHADSTARASTTEATPTATAQANADAAPPTITVDMPRRALGDQGLDRGEVVRVTHRPYGMQFARARTNEAFFLVLADDWRGELESRPLQRKL
jgi:hypothetical protein